MRRDAGLCAGNSAGRWAGTWGQASQTWTLAAGGAAFLLSLVFTILMEQSGEHSPDLSLWGWMGVSPTQVGLVGDLPIPGAWKSSWKWGHVRWEQVHTQPLHQPGGPQVQGGFLAQSPKGAPVNLGGEPPGHSSPQPRLHPPTPAHTFSLALALALAWCGRKTARLLRPHLQL